VAAAAARQQWRRRRNCGGRAATVAATPHRLARQQRLWLWHTDGGSSGDQQASRRD